VLALAAPAADAQLLFGSPRLFGRSAGIATWAIHNCGARPKQELEAVVAVGRKMDPAAFEKGRAHARAEAARVARKLRSKRAACAFLRSTYLKSLPDLKLLLDWPVRARR
jgi:hypothetical protein